MLIDFKIELVILLKLFQKNTQSFIIFVLHVAQVEYVLSPCQEVTINEKYFLTKGKKKGRNEGRRKIGRRKGRQQGK